jgi:hypothetical protein
MAYSANQSSSESSILHSSSGSGTVRDRAHITSKRKQQRGVGQLRSEWCHTGVEYARRMEPLRHRCVASKSNSSRSLIRTIPVLQVILWRKWVKALLPQCVTCVMRQHAQQFQARRHHDILSPPRLHTHTHTPPQRRMQRSKNSSKEASEQLQAALSQAAKLRSQALHMHVESGTASQLLQLEHSCLTLLHQAVELTSASVNSSSSDLQPFSCMAVMSLSRAATLSKYDAPPELKIRPVGGCSGANDGNTRSDDADDLARSCICHQAVQG